MASLRPNLGWFVAVYWLFMGAAEIQADYDTSSCSRESRSFQSKPDVPCDLVKNTFCDTSGEDYPWSPESEMYLFHRNESPVTVCSKNSETPWMTTKKSSMTQLRKFVFENQGLIKRMYGYQTHYTILKDEFLEALDEESFYDPMEMYSPEAQVISPEHTRKVRNSIRSNAFREKYPERKPAPEDDRAFLGEWQAEGQIYFDDRAEKIPKERSSSNRRQNARHIDDGSSGSRDVKMMSFQHSGKRSIDSSMGAVQNDQHLDDDHSNKPKTPNNFSPLRTVQIKQGYSQSTVEGSPTLTPEKLKAYSTERRSGEAGPSTDSPGGRQSAEYSSTSDATTPVDDLDNAALVSPDAQDSSRFDASLDDNADPEKEAISKEDKRKMDILFEELMNKADIITAKPLTAFRKPDEYFTGDNDFEPTERTINTTAPRPPNGSVEENLSSTSGLSESLSTQVDEDYVTTEASSPESSWISAEQQGAGISSEGGANETITFNPEYRSSPGDETDMITETDIPNRNRTSGELRPEDVSLQDNFKFPDEISTNHESTASEDSKSHRNSNTRRPAQAESRQPSKQSGNKWSGNDHSIVASPTNSKPIRVHSQFHNEGGGKRTSYRPSNDAQQPMWRRPQLEEDDPIATSTHPAPPTPSTIPTPLPRAPFKKGVNACPVETDVVAPYWANNTRGEVLALLNLSPFEQYVHWEKCRYEYRQMYCRQGCRCEQQYRLHRMLAFDPTNDCRGIFSDWFRFPSGCVCKCYDLPEQATRIPALYSRRPRGRSDPEPDEIQEYSRDHGRRPVQQDVGRPQSDGDLSDIYFESEDALLPLDHAQDRIDDDHLGDDEILLGASSTLYESRSHGNHIIDSKQTDSEAAVLDGEPVSSLYSRAEASKSKPKVKLQSIPPQRRPRPHVIGHRRQAALQQPGQDHGYNLRLSPSARALRYSPLATLGRFNFQPSQQFLSRRQYYQSRRFRARNGWNPHASFPSNLSNPRFLKYVDSVNPRKVSAPSRVDDPATDQGSNNLNLNHLMQPAPTSRILPSLIASSQLPNAEAFDSRGAQSPQYFFNLTSHLIRSEQLDSRRAHGSGFKTREPRNFFSDGEP